MRNESRISVADVDGGNRRTLTRAAGALDPERILATLFIESDPAWSPDGRRIAFHSIQGGLLQIHAMNPDGSGRVQLTSQGASYHPVWSPDGRRIAFLSRRGGPVAGLRDEC